MAQFLYTFRNTKGHIPSDQEGQAWMSWFEKLGPSIVVPGNPTGATSSLGPAPTDSTVTGYTVIEATDLEAAVLQAKGCPGLSHGGAVEVGEVIPM